MSKASTIILLIAGVATCVAAFLVGSAVAEDEPTSEPPIVAIDVNGEPIACADGSWLEFTPEALLAADAQGGRDGVVATELSGAALPRCEDGSIPDGAADVAGARQTSDEAFLNAGD